jgi:hypothetical protein
MTRRNFAHKLLVPAFALVTAFAFATADLGIQAQNTNSSETTASQVSPGISGGTDEDLSGTFTGNVRMSGAHEMASTPATLTITGNSFTLATADGVMNHSGTVRAVNSSGYIGAAFRFSDITDAASNNIPLSASVRARRSGDRLTLTPVPGERNRLWFNAGGGGGGGRRGRRRRAAPAPAPDATPEATPTPPPSN